MKLSCDPAPCGNWTCSKMVYKGSQAGTRMAQMVLIFHSFSAGIQWANIP